MKTKTPNTQDRNQNEASDAERPSKRSPSDVEAYSTASILLSLLLTLRTRYIRCHRCDTVFDRSRPKRKPSFFCNIWVCVHGPSVASPNVEALHWKDITFLLSWISPSMRVNRRAKTPESDKQHYFYMKVSGIRWPSTEFIKTK